MGQWYREHNIPCAAFELDLDRMFPNIERHAVPQAYEDLAKRYIQLVGMNRLQSSVYVSIAKGGARDWDCLGKKDMAELKQYIHDPQPHATVLPSQFMPESEYPENLLVRQLGRAAHRYVFVRDIVRMYSATRGLTTWMQMSGTFVLQFMRTFLFSVQLWCKHTGIAFIQPTCTPDAVSPRPSSVVSYYQPNATHQPKSRLRPQPLQPLSRRYDRQRQQDKHALRLLLALARATEATCHIHPPPLRCTSLPVWVGTVVDDALLGAHVTTASVIKKHGFLNAVWNFRDTPEDTLPHILQGVRACLTGAAPVRVTVIAAHAHLPDLTSCRPLLLDASYVIAHGVTRHKTSVQIWCLQNKQAADEWPIDHAVMHKAVGQMLKNLGLHLPPTPLHSARTLGLREEWDIPRDIQHVDPRVVFWRAWRYECLLRDALLKKRQWKIEYALSIRRTNQLLKYAPCRWLRALCNIIDWNVMECIEEADVWLYCVWSAEDGRLYWGPTGAREGPREILTRFWEELGTARTWHKLYGSKGVRGPTLAHVMHLKGVCKFCEVPVRRSYLLGIDQLERSFILRYSHHLNDRRPRARPYMRWLMRSGLHRKLLDRGLNDPDRWTGYIHSKHLSLDPMDALRSLSRAKGQLTPSKFSQLQTRLLHHVQAHAGLKLPRTMTVRIPFATSAARRTVKKEFRCFLHTVPYPKPLRAYLLRLIHVPRIVPQKTLHVWCTDGIQHDLETLRAMGSDFSLCGCTTQPEGPCEGKYFFDPQAACEFFGAQQHTVLQSTNNMSVRPGQRALHHGVAQSLTEIRRWLPKVRPFAYHTFCAAIHRLATKTVQQHTPPGRQALRDSHVTAFHRQHPNWVQSRVDKNAHLSVLICRSTFARMAHTALTASGNYRLYRSYRDAREATAVYMLAWYMFCNIVPVPRAHVPLRSMRSMLTRVVPQLRGVRLRVPQLDTPGHLAAADEWRTFKDTVFTHSLTIFQEAEEKNPLYLRPCPTPHGQRAVRLWKVPSVIISVKGKSLPCPDIVEAKLREIFTQAAHPTRLFFRRVSRALSVLVRTYTKTFFALEVVDQADLITSFLHPARHQVLLRLQPTGDTPGRGPEPVPERPVWVGPHPVGTIYWCGYRRVFLSTGCRHHTPARGEPAEVGTTGAPVCETVPIPR